MLINYLIPIIFNIILFFFKKKLFRLVNLYDIPDKKRKIHTEKIPLIGGTIIILNLFFLNIISILASYNFINVDSNLIINNDLIIFGFLFFSIGFLDDRYDLKPLSKTVIASIIFLFFLYLNEDFLINKLSFSFTNYEIIFETFETRYFITLFCFLVFQNAFNMIDGINLQCSIYTIIFLLFLYYLDRNDIYLLTIIPLIFFSILNYRNETFLGNNGVFIISFLLTFFILNIQHEKQIYSDYIFILMAFPGIDMLRLFFIRLKKGYSPFLADKNHIHHKLLKKFSYKSTLFLSIFNISLPLIIIIFLKNFFIAIFFFLLIYFYNIRSIKTSS